MLFIIANATAQENFDRAAADGDLETMRQVVGAVVKNEIQNTSRALWFAVEKNRPEILNYLIIVLSVDWNAENKNGQTPLIYAAMQGYKKIAKLLLSRESVKENIDHRDNFGKAAYDYAVEKKDEAMLDILLGESPKLLAPPVAQAETKSMFPSIPQTPRKIPGIVVSSPSASLSPEAREARKIEYQTKLEKLSKDEQEKYLSLIKKGYKKLTLSEKAIVRELFEKMEHES